MDSDDPTEELVVDITEEVPQVEDRGENNGPPLMWLGLAAVLLAGAVGLIFLIGRNRDDATTTESAAVSTTATTVVDSPADTPPIGDPGASATDDFESTADTSPPDEASDEATSTDDPSTSTTPTTTVSSAAPGDVDGGEGEPTPGSLVVGEPIITSTADDFEIMLTTSECTTIEWSFAGEGQAASYTSEDACFDEHLLSPRPEHPLLPATDYEVTASFAAAGEMQVITLSVTTAP